MAASGGRSAEAELGLVKAVAREELAALPAAWARETEGAGWVAVDVLAPAAATEVLEAAAKVSAAVAVQADLAVETPMAAAAAGAAAEVAVAVAAVAAMVASEEEEMEEEAEAEAGEEEVLSEAMHEP